jgi:hypothetical protein
LRTKLFILAFALVVALPVVQSNYANGRMNQSSAYVAMADFGPGLPAGRSAMKASGHAGRSTSGEARSNSIGPAAATPSGFIMGLMALGRMVLIGMGL